jgi:threonine dehydrogenase-like Zn-dependent dehydrogenase
MKAITYRQGRGLVFEELPDYQVGSDEVLVRVVNTGFCGSDHTLVESGGMVDGTILGHEVSGIVEDFGGVVKGVSAGT